MEKLRILQEQEKHIGASWKRFAISVSNLFAYEKDVETARLGDSKSRRELQMPYRRLQKSAVDDCLRILALQKVERSTPSGARAGVGQLVVALLRSALDRRGAARRRRSGVSR